MSGSILLFLQTSGTFPNTRENAAAVNILLFAAGAEHGLMQLLGTTYRRSRSACIALLVHSFEVSVAPLQKASCLLTPAKRSSVKTR